MTAWRVASAWLLVGVSQALAFDLVAAHFSAPQQGPTLLPSKIALEGALDILLKQAGAMERARDFAELFALIDAAMEPIPGLGELYVYDTSLRIGSRLNLLPKKVYLHAGTRRGARALGLNARAATLDVSDLPERVSAS